MPIKGITLIELLVVIAMIAVLAGVVGPNISVWSCKQELRNDFEKLNGYIERVRLEAVNQNKTTMVRFLPRRYMMAYQTSKKCQNKVWKSSKMLPLTFDRKSTVNRNFYYDKPEPLGRFRYTCFNTDGSSSGGNFTISRKCGTENYRFKTQILGATGFIEKLKYNTKTSKWDEL
jgi:prepilin-type N-terminal cleavage/methylation domain-containing protein